MRLGLSTASPESFRRSPVKGDSVGACSANGSRPASFGPSSADAGSSTKGREACVALTTTAVGSSMSVDGEARSAVREGAVFSASCKAKAHDNDAGSGRLGTTIVKAGKAIMPRSTPVQTRCRTFVLRTRRTTRAAPATSAKSSDLTETPNSKASQVFESESIVNLLSSGVFLTPPLRPWRRGRRAV